MSSPWPASRSRGRAETLAENPFGAHAVKAAGAVFARRALRHSQMVRFFARLPIRLVGMEACRTLLHVIRYDHNLARASLMKEVAAADFGRPPIVSITTSCLRSGSLSGRATRSRGAIQHDNPRLKPKPLRTSWRDVSQLPARSGAPRAERRRQKLRAWSHPPDRWREFHRQRQ
jgi:hypothetical protein